MYVRTHKFVCYVLGDTFTFSMYIRMCVLSVGGYVHIQYVHTYVCVMCWGIRIQYVCKYMRTCVCYVLGDTPTVRMCSRAHLY